MHDRQNALNNWLQALFPGTQLDLHPLAGDASFRRYFRLQLANQTKVVMDAPPPFESLISFIQIGKLLAQAGISVPKIDHQDQKQGFAIIEDFGDKLLLNNLSPATANKWYQKALHILMQMQENLIHSLDLILFDKAVMLKELDLFIEWFLARYLNLTLTEQEHLLLKNLFADLTEEISQQPTVFIHRDYHSRNILVLPDEELGIIDFQDAMKGPITYDLVSLLKDCYIQWPKKYIHQLLAWFYEHSNLARKYSLAGFIRCFDLCGLQRHLKVLGIFSRLHIRDQKSCYLKDLPLTLSYVMDCLEGYQEFQPLLQFLQDRVYLP